MDALRVKWLTFLTLALITGLIFSACENEDKDSRPYQSPVVTAAYVDGVMVSSGNLASDDKQATITLPPGKDLTKLKIRLTTINGELIDFPTDVETDYTHPMDLKVKSYNGGDVDIKFQVISKPLLIDLYIAGITVPKENVFPGANSIIVQVEKGTDLEALKVTMNFKNGELVGFSNGTVMNYTTPVSFQVRGVDGTIYPYQLILTDQKVGPASIQSLKANDAESLEITVDNSGNTQVYFKTLTNFASATLTIQTGFGNEFVGFQNGTVVNLWASPKVKIKGTDGIVKEFTFLKPKLKPLEVFRKLPADLGFGTDGGASLCFSGNYILASTHNGTQGIHYFDLTGAKGGSLKLPTGVDWGAVWGLRKIASDDKGAIVAVNLAAGGSVNTPYSVYKWNNVTDQNPVVLCSFTASELGLTATRTNGINVQGSLDGSAIITVPITASKVVLKWTIQGGQLVNAKPETISLDNAVNFGNYSSVEQYPGKASTLVGALALSDFSGIRSYQGGATAVNVAGSSTDLRMKKIGERVYLAHTVWSVGDTKHIFCLRDITADDDASYKFNMMEGFMSTTANGNATNDADLGSIDGKLYVAYLGTNGGVVCYALQP